MTATVGAHHVCVAVGRELGVAAPLNEAVDAILKLYRMGKPASDQSTMEDKVPIPVIAVT